MRVRDKWWLFNLLLQNLPAVATESKSRLNNHHLSQPQWEEVIDYNATPKPSQPKEVELLQALTHEIRTPLTTIRTLTRLLLKRIKLSVISSMTNDQ